MKGWGKFGGGKGKSADRFSPYGDSAVMCNDDDCKVFVGQLPYSFAWQDLKDLFAQVGTVTYAKIIMDHEKGKSKGKGANRDGWSKGMGLVEFSSRKEARKAIAMLDGCQLGERTLQVEPWTSDDGPKAKGKGAKAGYVWVQVPVGKSSGKGSNGKGKGNDDCKVYVAQLPYSAVWQELKDHFAQAGTVVHAKILCDRSKGDQKGCNRDGWSKGTGMVEFSSPKEARAAIKLLNGSEMGSRSIVVDTWTR
eukprot:gnl/MRDRNA2_/MRDRNA2_27504_c0_seq1.p1 gnl/MRDRNA2_/MRDRNA2_27504_c0~~gnl/MRDRNA2_/MRDRNA2_27504_c0_seq1.p1  ORF type:complete len:250 (-),score=56.17 gnl/MRDRNA2_/MRDRNA2_27504_c0_seq1:266-1015(-)